MVLNSIQPCPGAGPGGGSTSYPTVTMLVDNERIHIILRGKHILQTPDPPATYISTYKLTGFIRLEIDHAFKVGSCIGCISSKSGKSSPAVTVPSQRGEE